MNLLTYLERLNELNSIEAVWDLHIEAMSHYGFDRLLYGFTRYRTASSYGSHEDVLLLTNHDEEYVRQFIDSGMYFNAPMVNWAAENVGACSWSWMQEHADQFTPTERRIVELNKKYGILAGYTISFKDVSARAKGAIGLVGAPDVSQAKLDEVWSRHGREIVQMNNVAHLKLTSLPYSSRNRKLTARQREVLEWIGDGKTVQDTALLMGLTPATVEKHLRLAREALNVETTAQAVLKAAYVNQIFVIEP